MQRRGVLKEEKGFQEKKAVWREERGTGENRGVWRGPKIYHMMLVQPLEI